MQKIKNEKGITLIMLIITVIVIGLISIPSAIKINEIIELNELTKYKDDLTNLAETVSQVYSQDMDISGIGPQYNSTLAERIPQNQKNPNDSNVYYVIDADKLDEDLYTKIGATMPILNHGEANYSMVDEQSKINSANEEEDVYIINKQSRTIYYAGGFKNTDGETLYRYPGEYTRIEIQSLD